MEDLSFEVTGTTVAESNTFVLVNSVGTARRLDPGLNSSDCFSSEMLFRLPLAIEGGV